MTSASDFPKTSAPLLSALDYVASNKVAEEISQIKPEEVSIDTAFERDIRYVRVLKDLEKEVGEGGRIFANSLAVKYVRSEGLSAKDKALKEEFDPNRENAQSNILFGQGDIYSNATSFRYLIALAADNSKAVSLSYQRIDGWPSGNISSDVMKTVCTGAECKKVQAFLDSQKEEGAKIQDIVDHVAEEKVASCSRPNFSQSMSKQEFDEAVARSERAGAEAKNKLLPMVSPQARAKLEYPSHPLNTKDFKWEFFDGRASKVPVADGTSELLNKIRGASGKENPSTPAMARGTSRAGEWRSAERTGLAR